MPSLFTIHYEKGPLFTNHYTQSRLSFMTRPLVSLTLYLIETPFITFANRADPGHKSCLIRVYSVILLKYDISDPTQQDLTNNFFVLCTNLKICITIHSGWSLAKHDYS